MPEMSSASQWRLDVACSLAEQYATLEHVAGVMVGGSPARGQADRFSDIELLVVWSSAPTEEERGAVISAAGGDLHRLYPYDATEAIWEDLYFMGRDASDEPFSGCQVEIGHHLRETLDATITRILEQPQTDEALLNLLAGIFDGRILWGETVLRPWKERVAVYPSSLQHAVIGRYGIIDHFWRWQMYVERGNNLAELYAHFTSVIHHMCHLILALNRRYFGGWKWLDATLQQCEIKPERIRERLPQIFQVPPAEAASLLAQLVDETFALVEQHIEGIDVARMRHIFHWQRPLWAERPPLRLPID